MLSPVNVDYDPSNGSWNVFAIEVARQTRAMAEDPGEEWILQPYVFPTLGQAMHFLQPQIASPLKQETPGGIWSAPLKAKSPLQGTNVRISQLILMVNDVEADAS